MSVHTRLAWAFAGRDPGHARLLVASAVSAGVLASAGLGQYVVTASHADSGLLAMSIFLSVQAGSLVKDATPAARAVTTALLVPVLIIAIGVAVLLSTHHPLAVAGFALAAGAAIWVRRFGPRPAAMGVLGFMGYFFALVMDPAAGEIIPFCLVAAGAVTAQLLARLVLLLRRPRRELRVLLRELRASSAAAVRAASAGPPRLSSRRHPERTARLSLARLDEVGQAALDVHRNAHQGKVGVLTLAPEQGLGVTDPEKRARFETEINHFRDDS